MRIDHEHDDERSVIGDRHPAGRRGSAMLIVMVTIALCLTLTLAFLRTQATAFRIDANAARRDAALQAARSGAAVALREIQSPGWGGVGSELSGVVVSDGQGTASYHVTFHAAAPQAGESPQETALGLVVRSVGAWVAAADSTERTERTVEVLARLQPRLPGRTLHVGDSAEAEDLVPNPGDYDLIQTHALYASRDTSLVLDPQNRIDGPIRVQEESELFGDPQWSSGIRQEVLQSIGRVYSAGGTSWPLHPFGTDTVPAGTPQIVFEDSPDDALQNELTWLGIPFAVSNQSLDYPEIDYSAWQTYRLYAGGVEYQAEVVGSSLKDVTLAPSASNPLGIYYAPHTISLSENVTIVGTLVCADEVRLVGKPVQIASFDARRDAAGQPLFPEWGVWPRLPAIVARSVWIKRDMRVSVDGAVVVERMFSGAGGEFDYQAVASVNITGTATARPIAQPFSLVQLAGTPNLSAVSNGGRYAIWLSDGLSGSWYAISSVNAAGRELTVVGEVDHSVPTDFRIRRNGRRYAVLRGPVSAEQHDLYRTPAWGSPSSGQWNTLYSNWQIENEVRTLSEGELLLLLLSSNPLSSQLASKYLDLLGQAHEPLEFIDWLADPLNFVSWGNPHATHGMTLEPTFHLRNTGAVRYHWSPPLFRAYPGEQPDDLHAGYRWTVEQWRELP